MTIAPQSIWYGQESIGVCDEFQLSEEDSSETMAPWCWYGQFLRIQFTTKKGQKDGREECTYVTAAECIASLGSKSNSRYFTN